MNKRKTGIITPNGVVLEKHELTTVVFLTQLGYNIELIPPSNSKKSKTPDFLMNNILWEMKSPHGKSKASLEHIFKKATKQSQNIIIDLTYSKMLEKSAISEIIRCFNQSHSCRKLKIITKSKNLLEYKK